MTSFLQPALDDDFLILSVSLEHVSRDHIHSGCSEARRLSFPPFEAFAVDVSGDSIFCLIFLLVPDALALKWLSRQAHIVPPIAEPQSTSDQKELQWHVRMVFLCF